MFDLGVPELLLIVVAVAVFVAFAWPPAWVTVNQRWQVGAQGVVLERWLLTTLGSVAQGSVVAAAIGRISVVQRRTPGWAIVLAVLTLPLGLLFFLFKEERQLTVMITPDEHGGSRIDLIGATRKRTLEGLAAALVAEHGADAEPVTARP